MPTRSRPKLEPPPRSLYRKIQRLLVEARKGKPSSREQLLRAIDRAGHLDFTRYASIDGVKAVVPCSRASIERVLDLCVVLGFMGDDGGLGRSGASAADPERFNNALRSAVEKRLSEIGAPVAKVRDTARRVLAQASGDVLPTIDALSEVLTEPAKRREFCELIGLLAAAGGISFSRRKIYLP